MQIPFTVSHLYKVTAIGTPSMSVPCPGKQQQILLVGSPPPTITPPSLAPPTSLESTRDHSSWVSNNLIYKPADCVFIMIFWRQGLNTYLRLSWNSLCRSGWL